MNILQATPELFFLGEEDFRHGVGYGPEHIFRRDKARYVVGEVARTAVEPCCGTGCVEGVDSFCREERVMDLAEREVRRGSDPAEHPGSWFLAGAVSFSGAENTRFSALWEKARPDVIFKDRNEDR